MKTISTRTVIAAAVIASAFTASLTSATAATNPITCQTGPIAPRSVNFGGKVSICENSTTKQTRVTGNMSGLSKIGGHLNISVGAYRKIVSVCGVEDKTIDTGWLPGIDNWILQYADGGCPSQG